MNNIGLIFDSSYKIGGGHFWRCYNLAKTLKIRKKEFFFISNKLNQNFIKILNKDKFNYIKLDQLNNFSKIQKIIENKDINILISDCYKLRPNIKSKIKKIVDKLIVIDDHVNQKHNCNIYINNNFMDDNTKIKIKKLNPNTRLFLGHRYFIHNYDFSKLKKKKKITKKIKKVFAFFGSSDPSNETLKFIKAIENFANLKFKILIGKLNKNYLKIKSYCKNKKNIKIFYNLNNYSALKVIENVDFSFGSGGINLTERLFLGIPSVVVCTASNQKKALNALQKKKVIHYLGDNKKINTLKIRKCMNKFLENKMMVSQLSNKTNFFYTKNIKLNLLQRKLSFIINKKDKFD